MLQTLTNYSNRYGADPELVLAGGGNTSCKDETVIYIKGSGTSLATIKPEGFVKMDRAKLNAMLTKQYPAGESEREAAVLADLMAARYPGEENKRPSVETVLHNLFAQKYVLHVHPAKVNGITCAKNGEAIVKENFPEAVWVETTRPGHILAMKCYEMMNAYKKANGKDASMLILQNHGVFFAADSESELDALVASLMTKLDEMTVRTPDFTECDFDADKASAISPVLRMLWGEGAPAVVKFICNKEVLAFADSESACAPLVESLTPDHIVYCMAHPLYIKDSSEDGVKNAFAAYVAKYGYKPKVVFVEKLGLFCIGKDLKDLDNVIALWTDAMKVVVYTTNFGGVLPLSAEMIDFIVNWEVESYRAKIAENAEK